VGPVVTGPTAAGLTGLTGTEPTVPPPRSLPLSVATVMAHPDDAELWAGGILTKITSSGGTATIVVAHHDAERDAEARAGAAILGANIRFLETLTAASIGAMLA